MLLPATHNILMHTYSKMINTMIKSHYPTPRRNLKHDFYKIDPPKTLIKTLYKSTLPRTSAITESAKLTPPFDLQSAAVKWLSALKNVDAFSLNGGYAPSYAEHSVTFVPIQNWQWYVESKEGPVPGSVRQSGGGIGKLDSANEDGFFFKLNKSRLKKLKQMLKEKTELKRKGMPPDKKSDE